MHNERHAQNLAQRNSDNQAPAVSVGVGVGEAASISLQTSNARRVIGSTHRRQHGGGDFNLAAAPLVQEARGK